MVDFGMRIVIILVSIKILTGEKRMDKQFKMTRIAALVALAMPLLAHSEDQPAATVLPSVQVSAQKLGESLHRRQGPYRHAAGHVAARYAAIGVGGDPAAH
jgi:hypothetical protein